ncbi:MAG: hypothetical protein JW909_01560 [Planctomycetes bacterium]|nr:hypothetical protein [Planctomycetota bacterium]
MNGPPITSASWGIVVLSLLFVGPSLYLIWAARRGVFVPRVRRIRGIDAVDEAIGRSVEMGRPIYMSPGSTPISPLLWAVIGVIGHVAKTAARFRRRLVVPQQDIEVMALVEHFLRETYREAGRPELFQPENTPYLSGDQFAYASGYMGMVHRDNAGACLLFGAFAAESLVLAEAGQQVGAMQVAATTSYTQVPFFITTTDYTLIGEEVYAAGAYLSDDPVQKGSVGGQDFAKAVLLALFLVGILWATGATLLHRKTVPQVKNYDVGMSRLLYPPPEEENAPE